MFTGGAVPASVAAAAFKYFCAIVILVFFASEASAICRFSIFVAHLIILFTSLI
jgi:hypothetical protein